MKSLNNNAEFIFLRHTLNIREQLVDLIVKYKISKEEICQHFGIEKKDYDDFTKGAWHYSIETIAQINSLYIAYKQKETEKNVPIKI